MFWLGFLLGFVTAAAILIGVVWRGSRNPPNFFG